MKMMTVLLVMLVCCAMPVQGNDSAMNDGAYGPEPMGWRAGAESVIRMEAEHLTIDFHREYSDVRVVFTFRNTGRTTAKQLLGFPDLSAAITEAEQLKSEVADYLNLSGPMQDVQTIVNGEWVGTERQVGYIASYWSDTAWSPGTPENGVPMVWWTAWVDFPAGEPVTVERRYRVRNGIQAGGPNWFEYITRTGAAWQGTIGLLTADIYLHDGLTSDDIQWTDNWDDTATRTPARGSGWEIITPTLLRLQWRDFEPALQEDRTQFKVMTRYIPWDNREGHLLYGARTGGDWRWHELLADTTFNRNCRDAQGRTALYLAVDNRQVQNVRDLLAVGVNVNLADRDGRTPLMLAAIQGEATLVRELLARGARAAMRDRNGKTARDYALLLGREAVLRLLPRR